MRSRIFPILILLASCSTEGPTPTESIDANYEISQTDSTRIEIKAQFGRNSVDAYYSANLYDSDKVYLSTSGLVSDFRATGDAYNAQKQLEQQFIPLTREENPSETPAFWSIIHNDRFLYEQTIDFNPEIDVISIALLRSSKASADASFVQLPQPFSLVTPTQGTSFSRSEDDLLVEWSHSLNDIDEVYVHVGVNCGSNTTEEYSESANTDEGYVIIHAGTLSLNTNLTGSCNTEITVIKRNDGVIDPAFEDGYITAVQVRSVQVTTVD